MRDPDLVARAILAEPRFRDAHAVAAGPAPWWARWWDALLGALRRAAEAFAGLVGRNQRATEVVGLVVLVLVIAAFFALIVVLIPELRGARRRRRVHATASASLETATAAALAAGARAAAERGAWREAATLLVRASLRRLDERGRLPYDPARTPLEARRALGDGSYDAFAREAIPALYAGDPDASAFARLLAAYEAG